jgi:hypothetical protein
MSLHAQIRALLFLITIIMGLMDAVTALESAVRACLCLPEEDDDPDEDQGSDDAPGRDAPVSKGPTSFMTAFSALSTDSVDEHSYHGPDGAIVHLPGEPRGIVLVHAGGAADSAAPAAAAAPPQAAAATPAEPAGPGPAEEPPLFHSAAAGPVLAFPQEDPSTYIPPDRRASLDDVETGSAAKPPPHPGAAAAAAAPRARRSRHGVAAAVGRRGWRYVKWLVPILPVLFGWVIVLRLWEVYAIALPKVRSWA